MAHTRISSFVGLVAAGTLLVTGAGKASKDAGAQAITRTVFVSVIAKDGTPVTDLGLGDFDVKEGGRTQEITSVQPATRALRVHVIVSDGGTGAFQAGVLRFAQALMGRAEFAFTSVLVQPERVMDFTDRGDVIGPGIQRLGRRGAGKGGSQMMEAIDSALKDIAAPGKHPVLIVLRVGNEEPSPMPASALREALRMSGATMYVVSRAGASKAAPATAGVGTSAEVAKRQMDDNEVAETALQLNLVLGDGAKESGGYQQEIALLTAAQTLEQLANEINHQYEITYTLPAGVKPSEKLQVTTKRKNVTVRAPQKIAS